MKKSTLKLTLMLAMTIPVLTTVAQQYKGTEKMPNNISVTKKELKLAKIDSTQDYQFFRQRIEIKIGDNQKRIDELRKERIKENKKTNDEYAKKVNELEVKNNSLKKKMSDANKTETSQWTTFKMDFNREMEELGSAFRNLITEQKK